MESSTHTKGTPVGVALAAAIWLIAIGTVMLLIMRYGASPGTTGSAPRRWPDESALAMSANKPTLLLFVHPRCPCSSATLGELERALAECVCALDTSIIFVKPECAPKDWEDTALWRRARVIRSANAIVDANG